MAKLWHPDTCVGAPCILEIQDGHRGLIRIERLCSHHTIMRASLGRDDLLWDAMLAKNREKNKAITACVTSLGRVASSFPFSVGSDDRITITVIGTAGNRTTARTAVDTAVGGTGRVLIV